ncbi:hypothetical protein LEMLEM_LOCUS25869 [Lemmus lemmus]
MQVEHCICNKYILKKKELSMGQVMVAHAFNPSAWEVEAGGSL